MVKQAENKPVAKERRPKREMGPVSYEYTVRLAHMVKGIAFKKRAPRAIRELKKLAQKVMTTKDVRIDTAMNEMVWSRGIRYLPRRVRVQFCRKRNEDENAKASFYTLVKVVECSKFKGLKHEVVKED